MTTDQIIIFHQFEGDSLMTQQQVKNLPAVEETQEIQVWSLGQEDPLENPINRGAWLVTVQRVAKGCKESD